MQIGEPLRTIVVEPLESPVEQPTVKPEPEPEPVPSRRKNSRSHFADHRPRVWRWMPPG